VWNVKTLCKSAVHDLAYAAFVLTLFPLGKANRGKQAMSIQEGLYRVTFGTPMGAGYGVAYLADGHLHGGDSMMAYVGQYTESDGTFSAQVHSFQHSTVPGMTSVLGTNNAQLNVTGTVNGGSITGTGTAPQAPGVTLQLHLERLQH
jgi:hypothetical protein